MLSSTMVLVGVIITIDTIQTNMELKTEGLRMTFLDKAINVISPSRGLARMKSKAMQMGIMEGIRAYDAASNSRRTSGWNASGTSANNETRAAGNTLRDRSRELVRNNPYAKRAVQAISTNMIGLGIRPTPYTRALVTSRSLSYGEINTATTYRQRYGRSW